MVSKILDLSGKADEPKYADEGDIEFVPMPGKIVVEVIGDTEKIGELGLIIRPQTSRIPRTTGRVIAVYDPFKGDADAEVEPYVNVGDIVIFGQFSGTTVEMGRKTVIVLREQEILTKVVKATAKQIDSIVAGNTDTRPDGED